MGDRKLYEIGQFGLIRAGDLQEGDTINADGRTWDLHEPMDGGDQVRIDGDRVGPEDVTEGWTLDKEQLCWLLTPAGDDDRLVEVL